MSKNEVPTLGGVPLKYVSLLTLTVQNSALTILLHYSRVYGAPYSAAAAVLLNELLKISVSIFVALRNSYQQDTFSSQQSPLKAADLSLRLRKIQREVLSPDCWKLSIPAILYVIQNNLQFVAASNLDVATFQVSYQMKILTTALFSVIILKRRLSTSKWASLLCLALGVAIVQIQSGEQNSSSSSSHQAMHTMNPSKGFLAVSLACITSGIAGVYFELILKGSQADLWIRNIQLAGWSIIPALVPAFFPDFQMSDISISNLNPMLFISTVFTKLLAVGSPDWMFAGFGFWAWSVVLTQVFGGLVTALVIKFSDNIMKGFATSLSIVISFLAGCILFGFTITPSFVIGCSVVLASTYVYNKPAADKTVRAAANQIKSPLMNADKMSSPLLSQQTSVLHSPFGTPQQDRATLARRSFSNQSDMPLYSVPSRGAPAVALSFDSPDAAHHRKAHDASTPDSTTKNNPINTQDLLSSPNGIINARGSLQDSPTFTRFPSYIAQSSGSGTVTPPLGGAPGMKRIDSSENPYLDNILDINRKS